MRLCPHEPRVDEFYFLQPFDALYAKRQQFFGLQIRANPVFRRLQVTFALRAVLHRRFFRDALGDVHLRSDALDAHPSRVRAHRDATEAT